MAQALGGIPRNTIHPGEQFGVAFQYIQGTNMPAASELSSAVVASRNRKTGRSTSTDVLTTTVGAVSAISGGIQTVTASVKGGGSAFNETEHVVEITSTLDSGELFVDTFILVVNDRVED